MTSVRYFPRTGLVFIKATSVTMTFSVSHRYDINAMLDYLGYERVKEWRSDGACHVAYTQRVKIRAVQPAA